MKAGMPWKQAGTSLDTIKIVQLGVKEQEDDHKRYIGLF